MDQDQIALFGHSLGTAIAVETAVRREVYAVLLEAPFTSIGAMAAHSYPFVPGIGRILRTKYDSLSKIENVGTPLLVLHGDRDDTVPIRMGRERSTRPRSSPSAFSRLREPTTTTPTSSEGTRTTRR